MLRDGVALKPLGRFVAFAALAFVSLFYPEKTIKPSPYVFRSVTTRHDIFYRDNLT